MIWDVFRQIYLREALILTLLINKMLINNNDNNTNNYWEYNRNNFEIFDVGGDVVSVTNRRTLNVSNTSGHAYKVRKQHCSRDFRKHFFTLRIAEAWNKLL